MGPERAWGGGRDAPGPPYRAAEHGSRVLAPPPSSEEINFRAITGRLLFVAAAGALLYGSFFHFPRLFASTHVAHFAGFFLFTLATTAAAKRTPLLTIGCYVAAVAILLEIARALTWLPLDSSYLDLIGDMGGVVAALAPMLLQKIRSGFRP